MLYIYIPLGNASYKHRPKEVSSYVFASFLGKYKKMGGKNCYHNFKSQSLFYDWYFLVFFFFGTSLLKIVMSGSYYCNQITFLTMCVCFLLAGQQTYQKMCPSRTLRWMSFGTNSARMRTVFMAHPLPAPPVR